MKKEEAYRHKSGCYVAFEYDGHVFVLKTIKGTANGKTWTTERFTFCPISSDTEFAVRFTTVEEAITAVEKMGLNVVYTQEWAILENKNFNTFCVDKLKWKEWNECQEVQRHRAPFAAIAVDNRVYKDTYSTALSDGSRWVFAAGAERLPQTPGNATHKIDLFLKAAQNYPQIELFDTEEERTEWSLKYLEEYAAIPEPTPVVKEQKVVPIGSIIDPMGESWNPDKQTYCCAACHGVLYFPTWGKGSSCTFQSDSGSILRHADGSMVTGHNTYRSLCQAVVKSGVIDMHACYTQSRKAYELFIKAHIPKEKQQELQQELPGVDITEQELPPVGSANVPKNSCIVHAFESQGIPKFRPVEIAELPPGSVIEVDSHAVVDSSGLPLGWTAVNIHSGTGVSPFILEASPDSQALTADSSIKTMKSGVTPQPSRSRIGKIAARPYEYVYDGPQQMGTTFVSRYRIDDEVWVRVGHELVKMKVTGIYVERHKQGSAAYSYFLKHPTLTIGGRAESELYDTLFDLISAMTSISVEELIAAAKEVV